jgi:putative hydrolase of the HAD superfamily
VIRAVFFDVDDTLIDYDAAARAAFHEVFGEDVSFEQWLVHCDPHFERYGRGEVDFETMRVERTADFLRVLGRPVPADGAAAVEAHRFALVGRRYTIFDDVPACLDELRSRGLRLGLITNNEPVHQRGKLARVGLDSGFDAVVISGEVGVAKPDAAIFSLACSRLGVAAAEAAHIGDRLDIDALGAHGAGLRGVWLDRRGAHDGSELPVSVLPGLAGLPALLD